jgi:hypothetical protein
MYGGASPATEYAMKAAKHELRSTIAYFSTNACRVPLVAIVDFRGYRVLCSSVLPIDSTTICYGSSDAGKTVHSDLEATELFNAAAAKLNLKSHKFKNHELSAPIDVEGHHGHDGRMYCIDLARLFPPEAPSLALQAHPRAMFFRLLRPELVRLMPNPLSSDAFTSFGADNAAQHNAEVELATRHLQTILIPNFSKSLYAMGSSVNSFSSLVYQTHKNGINLRYLGLIRNCILVPEGSIPTRRVYIPSVAPNDYLSLNRSLDASDTHVISDSNEDRASRADEMMSNFSQSPSDPLRTSKQMPAVINPHAAEEAIRQLLLEEMIARVLKGMLRAQWRKRMQEVRICTETPFAAVLLDLMNIVACKSSMSRHFWTIQLKEELKAKYSVGLTAQELDPEFDLLISVDLRSLLERFISLVGVKITLTNDILAMKTRPFLYTDLHSISSTIHHMNIIDFAEGRLLAMTARKRDKTLKLQLLSMAETKLTSAHSSGTNVSLSVVFELANVHYEKSMLLPLQECTSNVIEAVRCYTAALSLVTTLTASSVLGKCHIRLLRLFFERLGPNILLQESALQAQGISEMTIAKHMDGAASLRPRAFRKLVSKVAHLPEPEPSHMLLTTYLPDCSPIATFGALLTCLAHSTEPTRLLACEVFEKIEGLNFQFCPQLLDPLNSGWMIGTQNRIWHWTNLKAIDLTACLTANSQTLAQILAAAPVLSTLVLNQCQSLDDSLADLFLNAPTKVGRLEISSSRISDHFFQRLDKGDVFLQQLTYLNLRNCEMVTDITLKILISKSAILLKSLFLDACPNIIDIKPLKRFKNLTELGISACKAPEAKLKAVMRHVLGRLSFLDISITSVVDGTFEVMDEEGAQYPAMTYLSVRKSEVTKKRLEAFALKMPNLITLIVSSCELGHGFGKHISFPKLMRFESSLNKWTSGCDVALVTLKNANAPINHLGLRSCWNTITDPVLLLCVRSFASLTSLNISVCTQLSNAAMESVSNLKQLGFLSLSGNRQLVDSALIRIAKALGGTLTGLEIAHCKQISTFGLESISRYCTNLRYIDISFVESFRRIHQLGFHCLHLESIKSIGLTGCAAESFQRLFNRGISLRRVNFKSCPITNDAVIACAYASRFLTEICLSDCSAVDDVGITRLLQLCRYIHKLELTSVSVSDASFVDGRRSLKFLRYLSISGCRKLTDKTFTILQHTSTLLEFVNCSGCPLLSEEAVCKLIESAKSLKSVSIAFCPRITEEGVESVLTPRGGSLVK